jgi:predicted transcriptional regulator
VTNNVDTIEMTAGIVAAYVGANSVPASDLPGLIQSVYRSLVTLDSSNAPAPPPAELVPAVPPKKSITPDYLICLEDGKKFKSLKRHLRVRYGLSPEQYRTKWGLPVDYPMVAPNYAKARSELAKEMGLGQSRKRD